MKKFIIVLLLATACKKDNETKPELLDINAFTKVENPTILLSLKPTAAYDYVELRMSSGQGPMGNEMYLIRASAGNKMELAGACLDLLDNLPLQEKGFAEDCTPLCYYHYLVAAKNRTVTVYNSLNSLKEYLGDIKKNTRHYAKRQMTWFKKDTSTNWFSMSDIISLVFFLDAGI